MKAKRKPRVIWMIERKQGLDTQIFGCFSREEAAKAAVRLHLREDKDWYSCGIFGKAPTWKPVKFVEELAKKG